MVHSAWVSQRGLRLSITKPVPGLAPKFIPPFWPVVLTPPASQDRGLSNRPSSSLLLMTPVAAILKPCIFTSLSGLEPSAPFSGFNCSSPSLQDDWDHLLLDFLLSPLHCSDPPPNDCPSYLSKMKICSCFQLLGISWVPLSVHKGQLAQDMWQAPSWSGWGLFLWSHSSSYCTLAKPPTMSQVWPCSMAMPFLCTC